MNWLLSFHRSKRSAALNVVFASFRKFQRFHCLPTCSKSRDAPWLGGFVFTYVPVSVWQPADVRKNKTTQSRQSRLACEAPVHRLTKDTSWTNYLMNSARPALKDTSAIGFDNVTACKQSEVFCREDAQRWNVQTSKPSDYFAATVAWFLRKVISVHVSARKYC